LHHRDPLFLPRSHQRDPSARELAEDAGRLARAFKPKRTSARSAEPMEQVGVFHGVGVFADFVDVPRNRAAEQLEVLG
jgi:hypothetical protein